MLLISPLYLALKVTSPTKQKISKKKEKRAKSFQKEEEYEEGGKEGKGRELKSE